MKYIPSPMGTLRKNPLCRTYHDQRYTAGFQSVPSGVELLSLLLEVSVHVSNHQSQLLLVSLLRATVRPYFRLRNDLSLKYL